MVADMEYYETLGVSATATHLEIKKAYRKLAIKHHPDKNPNDPQAAQRFQKIGEAYQVLSDDTLRSRYDQYGKENAVPKEGFEDSSEFFAMIFGGSAFLDYIGELTLLKNLTQQFEVEAEEELRVQKEKEEKERKQKEAEAKASDTQGSDGTDHKVKLESVDDNSDQTGTTHNNDKDKETQSSDQGPLALESSDVTNNGKELTPEEREKFLEEKRQKEKQEKLDKLEEENRLKKQKMTEELTEKLIQRVSLLTETDQAEDVVKSFTDKMKYEAEELKMESFGLEILHTIGSTYRRKAKNFLKSQKTFGAITGFFSSVKETGGVVMDTYRTITTALEAQTTMEKMAKMTEKRQLYIQEQEAKLKELEDKINDMHLTSEEDIRAELEKYAKAEEEKLEIQRKEREERMKDPSQHAKLKEEEEAEYIPTEEELMEMEKLLMGKILAAAWKGSQLEISKTLRDVCDNVLNDDRVSKAKRADRARAMIIIGDVFTNTERSKWEAEEARIFEELVAEASQKKTSKK